MVLLQSITQPSSRSLSPRVLSQPPHCTRLYLEVSESDYPLLHHPQLQHAEEFSKQSSVPLRSPLVDHLAQMGGPDPLLEETLPDLVLDVVDLFLPRDPLHSEDLQFTEGKLHQAEVVFTPIER